LTNITLNISGLKRAIKELRKSEAATKRKAQQAVNRTLLHARTQMTAEVHSELNLKKKNIRSNIKLRKATKVTGPNGVLKVQNNPVGLIHYAARQTKKGTTFKIKRQGSRQRLNHTFIANQAGVGPTVFRREGAARLRIRPVYGSSVASLAKGKLKVIRKKVAVFMVKELSRLLGV
jgi:hypothetical protein